MALGAQDLDIWLEPFLAALGHKKRRLWAPLYLRGLLGPSERKSLQPMAACLGLGGHDQLLSMLRWISSKALAENSPVRLVATPWR